MTTATATSPAQLLPVLVATRETQGRRRNDFFYCDEEEPVRFSLSCDGERIDGPCGCRRCMTGMFSRRGTTTIRVKDLPITREQFVSMLKTSYADSGFPVRDKEIADEAAQLLDLAAAFAIGPVIEKRGNKLQQRG